MVSYVILWYLIVSYSIFCLLIVLHCMVLYCIVSYIILWYPIPLHGIACYCIVGFGARAVSHKMPSYFIFYIYPRAFWSSVSTKKCLEVTILWTAKRRKSTMTIQFMFARQKTTDSVHSNLLTMASLYIRLPFQARAIKLCIVPGLALVKRSNAGGGMDLDLNILLQYKNTT